MNDKFTNYKIKFIEVLELNLFVKNELLIINLIYIQIYNLYRLILHQKYQNK